MRSLMYSIARAMALLGGIVLLVIIVLTCASVIGRMGNTLGHSALIAEQFTSLAVVLQKLGPVNGDFEIVEAGVAFAIMAFFPWCMINRGHASVDVFTSFLPVSFGRFLELLWEFVFAVALGFITWRMYIGTTDKFRYKETTLLLEFPVWWGFAACTAAAVVASLVAAYVVWMRFDELVGRRGFESETRAEH